VADEIGKMSKKLGMGDIPSHNCLILYHFRHAGRAENELGEYLMTPVSKVVA
jgi:hypothetical protein